MKSIRDSEFVQTLPESIAHILNELLVYAGLFVALVGAVYFGTWWAFPAIFLLFVGGGYGLIKILVRKRSDKGK